MLPEISIPISANHVPGSNPIRANLLDMVMASEELEREMQYVAEDAETYGVLTADTFLENAPVSHGSFITYIPPKNKRRKRR